MQRTKIFISAYACEPNMGTEIGVGWHWSMEMSKYFEVWVLTRKSNQKHIEDWLKENKEENQQIHFVYFDLPPQLRFWKKGLRGVRIYYNLWQLLTNHIVKQTMEENEIKIYHLLTYGNSLWPASSYGQKQIFVWGPTGGVDYIPREYSKYYSAKSRLTEFFRRVIVYMLPINFGFQRRCSNADLIFCKSINMLQAIPEKKRSKAMIFTDVAIDETNIAFEGIADNNGTTNFLAVGRLEGWRGFDILIEAFSIALKENQDLRLDILGSGNDEKRLLKLIKRKELEDKIILHGTVSLESYYDFMKNADIVVNSCLKEGAVTAAFDALSFGKPLIGIDTGGYTRYFKSSFSIIIKRESREKTIQNLSQGIVTLGKKDIRIRMSENAKNARKSVTWEQKGKDIQQKISELLKSCNIKG